VPDFKAKMHQIRFRLGLCPRPSWGSLQRSPVPDPLAGFKGPTSKGREGMGGGRDGRKEGRKGRGKKREGEGKGGDLLQGLRGIDAPVCIKISDMSVEEYVA